VFDRFAGLPAHPLMVHAAVVLLPLLAIGGVLYAVAPFTRRHIRWPVIFLALAAPGAVLSAKLSGEEFKKNQNLQSPEIQTQIGEHQEFGEVTVWLAAGLAVLVLALTLLVHERAATAVGRGTDDTSVGAGARGGAPMIVQIVLAVLTVGFAGAALFYVFQTGDSGANLVWNGF
jgi:hypothetical protein